MRLIIAYKNPKAENPVACHVGLGVTTANTCEVLNEHGLDAEAVPVVDGYHLQRLLRQHKWPGITHLLLSAPFFDTPFLKHLCHEFPTIVFGVLFHSNVGFLSVDNWSTGVLGEEVEVERHLLNFHVAGNSRKFCHAVEQAFKAKCTLLPNLYYIDGPVQRVRDVWTGGTLRIGAFGATRVLKNFGVAAWSARIIAQTLNARTELWVSAGRAEGSGSENVLKNIEKLFKDQHLIKLVEAPWKPWGDFRSVVRKMHLTLQPSFTESFNGTTADSVAEGVPAVVSHAIDWVPTHWQANPDDAVEIAAVGLKLLKDREAPSDGYKSLVKHNEWGLAAWKKYLGVHH